MADKGRVQLLVDALLSGDYKQGFGVLEKHRGTDYYGAVLSERVAEYCCLGVACRVALANGVRFEVFEGAGDNPLMYFSGQTGTLPESVRDWFEFDEVNPRLIDDEDAGFDHNTRAIDMNDNRRESFELIAMRFKLRYIDETDEARAETKERIGRLELAALDAAQSVRPELEQ